MLQPKKSNKKPSPAKKYKTSQSEVDWDLVRNINDNPAVQAAKMFDPTGISSYPDVYYAVKDLAEGKGSWAELGINVLGALPMVGKAKVAFRLAKAGKGNKTVKATQKVLKTVEKVAQKSNKIVNAPINKLKPLANSTKVVPKVIGKTAEKTEQLAKAMGKPLTPKGQTVTSKQITKSDVKNVAVDLLDISNVAADVSNTVTATTKKVKEVQDKKEAESYQPVPKKVVYYNTDPKRGEVEKPGTDSNVSYTPVTNSVQLKKWQEQKLVYGTNSQGIMKNKMNPRKKYANGSSAKGMDPNNYIISPAEALNDYNIMLAKAEAEANSNPWLPIVAIAGQAMQTGIGIAGKFAGKPGGTGGTTGDTTASAAMGMNNVQADVEVEGGEMYETPQGQVGEFQGPSHEQGGIPLEVGQDVEEGTKVYSDRLKVGKKTLAERKATRERQIANLEKIASNSLADAAVKNAAKRKMMAIQKEEAADLDFQEKVNNMQAIADNMVEAFACGTGMKGIQKMAVGGVVGDPPFRFYNYDVNGNYIGPALPQPEVVTPANRLLNANKALEDYLNSPEHKKADTALDTIITKTDADTKAMTETGNLPSATTVVAPVTPSPIVNTGKTGAPGFVEGFGMDVENTEQVLPSTQTDSKFNFNPIEIPTLNLKVPSIAETAANLLKPKDPFAMTAGEDWAKANPLPEGIEEPMPETIGFKSEFFPEGLSTDTNKSTDKKEPSKLMKALAGNMPAVGDMTKLIGNYLGMTAGIKTAAEQRSTDVTHRNVFANAGRESQRLLDNAKQGIETSKAQAIVKATDVGRGGKRGARGTARGVNQMRSLDFLYDTALQSQIAEISAKAAEQISGIDIQKSGVAMNADQLKGQGEYQAAMANEAAKDAYYTALALGRKDFATGLQQTGKDFNDMKQNKVINNLLSQYGQWFKTNADGTVSNKNEVASKSTNTTKEKEIELTDAKGKKFKITQSQFDKLMNPTV